MNINDDSTPPVKPIAPPPVYSNPKPNLFEIITGSVTPKQIPIAPPPKLSSLDEFVYSNTPITAPPKPTPTPATPTTQVIVDNQGDYGEPKYEDENICPEGFTKNYNRQGKLECLPNYNDIADCGSPTMCTEDEEFVDCKCQKKTTSAGTQTPTTPTAPTVTKNLKPILIGAALILGLVVISKVFKSNS